VETKIPFDPTYLDHYTYDNLTVFITHLGQIHCFDLETATLKWTLQESFYASKAVDSLVFGVQNNHIVKLNLLTKTIKPIASVAVVSTFWTGTPFFDVFKKSDGDICLSNIYSKNQQLTLLTQNLTKNTIIAEHEIYSDALEGGFSSFFKVAHDRAYYGNSEKILCRNLQTGVIEWLKSFPAQSGGSCGSELFFGDDELFMAAYGNQYLVGLDWATGAEFWRIKNDINGTGFGSMADFYYYKKILYWASGSFQAVEGATGKVIWCFKDEFGTDAPLTFYHLPTADGNLLYVPASSNILCIKMAETFVSRLLR
jgi:outer membrane protein assembly factor BamB